MYVAVAYIILFVNMTANNRQETDTGSRKC